MVWSCSCQHLRMLVFLCIYLVIQPEPCILRPHQASASLIMSGCLLCSETPVQGITVPGSFNCTLYTYLTLLGHKRILFPFLIVQNAVIPAHPVFTPFLVVPNTIIRYALRTANSSTPCCLTVCHIKVHFYVLLCNIDTDIRRKITASSERMFYCS